jgi:3-oxoacyl-[acyl-carrier-protein] synthase II
MGSTVASAWDGIVNGRSGIRTITKLDVSAFPARIGGEVVGFNAEEYMSLKDIRKFDPFVPFGFAAAVQAVKDSGIQVTEENSARIGVAIGAGIGGLSTIEENTAKWLESKSPRKISPFFIPGSIINAAAGQVSIHYGMRGPNLALVTACTTSTHSIGIGARCIQYGDADVMIAGGAEMAFTPLGLGSFGQAKALSLRNDEPERASRPWDRDRDGFVMSEGAGAIVLEEYEQARARGAQIYAELIGFGMSGDAHHITAPPEDGEGARLAMSTAIRDAGIPFSDVHYVNAHATSTGLGDWRRPLRSSAPSASTRRRLL